MTTPKTPAAGMPEQPRHLDNCPFCGCVPVTQLRYADGDLMTQPYIGVRCPEHTRFITVEQWNNRASLRPTAEDRCCRACKGSGTVVGHTTGLGPDDHEIDVNCPDCNGTGETAPAEDGLVERCPEINPSNYNHDDVVALNDWAVEAAAALSGRAGVEKASCAHKGKTNRGYEAGYDLAWCDDCGVITWCSDGLLTKEQSSLNQRTTWCKRRVVAYGCRGKTENSGENFCSVWCGQQLCPVSISAAPKDSPR